jgi:hypothetical protein
MANEGLSIKERIVIFTPIVLVIIFVLIFFKFKQTSKDDFYNEVVPSEFHGIIVEKYLKEFNHAEPKIKYQFDNSIIDISVFNWIDFYDHAKIGDSIFKNEGDSVLCLKRKMDDSIYRFRYFFDKGWGIVRRW